MIKVSTSSKQPIQVKQKMVCKGNSIILAPNTLRAELIKSSPVVTLTQIWHELLREMQIEAGQLENSVWFMCGRTKRSQTMASRWPQLVVLRSLQAFLL